MQEISQKGLKSRKAALILAAIPYTGWLGIDRFYLGYIGMGMLKLFTCGGFFVIYIMDIVRISRGTMTDNRGRPLFGNPVLAANRTTLNMAAGTKKFLAWSIINTICFFFTVLPIVGIIQSIKGRKAIAPEERKKRNRQATLFNLLSYVVLAILIVAGIVINHDRSAATLSYRGFRYYVGSDGGIVISGYNGTARSVHVPATIDGNPVIAIGSRTFYGNQKLKSVTIPDSVASIGDSAFSGCTGLVDIDIPDSVANVGYNAFSNTAWFVAKPVGIVYIGEVAYIYKGDISIVEIAEIQVGTKRIGNDLFYGAVALAEISIPDSVTSIGSNAFRGCTGLVGIALSDNVESIGNSAFYGCTGLTSVTFGSTLKSIGEYAFANCVGLTNIVIPDSVTKIAAGSLNYRNDYRNQQGFRSDPGTNYRWVGAFGDCTNLSTAIYRGETYSVVIRGYWSNGDAQHDLPEHFYIAVNGS